MPAMSVYYCEEHRVRMTQLCRDPVTELQSVIWPPLAIFRAFQKGPEIICFKGACPPSLPPSLFRFLNDSFLQHFWVAPDRTQRTYITAPWCHRRHGCHGNARPCLLLFRSHCLSPGSAKHMFSRGLYDAPRIADYLLISALQSEINNKKKTDLSCLGVFPPSMGRLT